MLRIESVPSEFTGHITYHDSCSGLREMGVKSQPRALLDYLGLMAVRMGARLDCTLTLPPTLARREVCRGCGGMGTMSVAESTCPACRGAGSPSPYASSWPA